MKSNPESHRQVGRCARRRSKSATAIQGRNRYMKHKTVWLLAFMAILLGALVHLLQPQPSHEHDPCLPEPVATISFDEAGGGSGTGSGSAGSDPPPVR